jgi:radical SAM protein with 4Fe4S-binding SPASM domain
MIDNIVKNKYVFSTWRFLRRIKAKIFPKRKYALQALRFAITNICNAKCVFCSYPRLALKSQMMSMEVFEKSLQLLDKKILTVDLSPAVGEPTVDKTWKEKVNLAHKIGYKVAFSTNGWSLINDWEWLLQNYTKFDYIQISIPSFDERNYKIQYGVDFGKRVIDGLYKLVVNNNNRIQLNIKVRNRDNPKIEKSSKEYKKFEKFFCEKITCEFTSLWENWSDNVSYDLWSPWMLNKIKVSKPINRPCKALNGALVNPDGTIRLCACRVVKSDHDDLIIGDVNNTWEELEKEAIKIRNRYYKMDFPEACRGCSFYNPE